MVMTDSGCVSFHLCTQHLTKSSGTPVFIGKVEGEVFRQHLTNISPTSHSFNDDYDHDHDLIRG